MNNINVYTVEEEEASCLICEHVCEKEDWCEKYCGPKHGWNHYERLEFVEKAEDKMNSNKWQNCFIEKESFYTALFFEKNGTMFRIG